jgi:hypothetical protein
MRGSPRSLMLTWANTVSGWWTSVALRELQRRQRAILAAMIKPRLTSKPPPRKQRKR